MHRGEAFGARGRTLGEAVFADRDDRLPGDADRPELPPPDRGGHGPAHRQHRVERRGRRVGAHPGRRLRRPRPGPPAVQLALDGATSARSSPRQGVVGLAGDRHPRRSPGACARRARCAPACSPATRWPTPPRCAPQVLDSPEMAGADLAGAVSTARALHGRRPPARPASGSPRSTSGSRPTPRGCSPSAGIETRVLPSSASIDELLDGSPDGVFLSNGPGDPAAAEHAVALTAEVLRREVPLFGICFGNQILGRALGLGTYKMRYGHRGINVPVVDHTTARWRSPARTTASRSPARRGSASTRRSAACTSATGAPTTASSRA